MAALILVLMVGFTLGWTLAGQTGWTLVGDGGGPEGAPAARLETPPPAAEPSTPSNDVPGKDISGLPRYPGSVRSQYTREDLDEVIWTEVEYVTAAAVDAVREYYRGVFRTEGWSVGDVGFSNGAWSFFVIQDEREVYVELQPRDEIVEVDFELTEPKPDKKLKPEQKNEPEKRSLKKNREPAPQQQALATSQPAPFRPSAQTPVPGPAYDYDGYGEEYDNLEGGED